MQDLPTRPVDDLVKAMGMEGISKRQVSRFCADIDDRRRPSNAEPGFQPAHRFAEAGGAAAASPRRLAKPCLRGPPRRPMDLVIAVIARDDAVYIRERSRGDRR